MRQSAGTSVKSSLSHTFLYDTRDDKIAATRGAYGKFFQELAGFGIGGDAQFYKVETEGQVSRKVEKTGLVRLTLCLASQILTFLQSVSLAARTGLLWSLAHGGRTLFSDRFQLGGPTSVRSFKASGMGPKDGRKYSSCSKLRLASYFLQLTRLEESCTTLQAQVLFRIYQPKHIGHSRRIYGSMQEGWIT
jgi:outer membrane protein insertion porin family